MLNTGMIESHPDHGDLADELRERRAAFRRLLAEKLRRWVDEGRAQSLARYLTAAMQGMAIQARDGADFSELDAIATEVCCGLEAQFRE